MKKCTQFLLVCLALVCFSSNVRASHAAGGEIIYQWLNGATYRVIFKFYRDCSGVSEPQTQQICVYNTCNNTSLNVPPAQKMAILPGNIPNGSPVSLGCPGFGTTCDNGTLPGYREWWYSVDVTLPTQCENWVFYTGVGNRNQPIDNIGPNPQNQVLFIRATLDNVAAQGNSSPYFTVKPVPYTCVNTPFTYNNGAVDPDGDSLSFELVYPQTGPLTCTAFPNIVNLIYAPPSGTNFYNNTDNPFNTNNTFSLNQFNGQMSFTPAVQSENVVSVKVHEYRNGLEIGTIIRDIQIIIRPCTVPPPAVNVDPTSVYVGTFINGQVEGCANQPMHFCFDAFTLPNRILVVNDNHQFISNNITVTYTNQATDTVTGCVDWLPGYADTGLHIFVLTVKDSTCEPPGIPITNTFTIPIHIWPATEVIIQGDSIICPNEFVNLLAIGGANYHWTVLPGGDDTTSLTCTYCDNPTVSPSVTTTYVVTSTINTYCDENRDTITITVRQPATFDLGPDITTCVNNTVQMNTNLIPVAGTNYSVQWSPGTYLNDPTSNTPVMNAADDITYIVTIIPDGFIPCGRMDTINVTVLQGFDVTNGDTAVCMGDTVTVNATGDIRYTYSWSPVTGVSDPSIMSPYIVPDTTHTYVVTATYPNCRDSIQAFTIDAQPVAIVDAGPPEMIVCIDSRVQLNATIDPPGYPYYTLVWSPGSSLTATDILDPIFVARDTTMLHFTVTTPIGCKGEDSILINVIPSDFLEISPNQSICPRDTVQVHVMSDGSTTISSVSWPEDFHYISDPTSLDPYVAPSASTDFTVVATDVNGCKDTINTFIEVKAAAIVSLPDSAVIYPGESYQIDPGGNCLYFSWFPPEGLSADKIANPIATPLVNTRYYVDAANESGCVTRDSIDLIVAPDSYIELPNAFTPGSAPNNILKVLHMGTATLKKFAIYNRWGQLMFETTDINKGWDGNYEGNPQPLGVYVYTVEAVSPRGKRFVKQGNVTLIR